MYSRPSASQRREPCGAVDDQRRAADGAECADGAIHAADENFLGAGEEFGGVASWNHYEQARWTQWTLRTKSAILLRLARAAQRIAITGSATLPSIFAGSVVPYGIKEMRTRR